MNAIIESRITALTGFEFQHLCDRLLLKLYPEEYTPVRPGGRLGDLKNDGYCIASRIFFHAFGSHGTKTSDLKKKIITDVTGVTEKQRDVRKVIFLTNRTQVAALERLVDDLRRDLKIEIEIWGHQKLAPKIQQFSITEIEEILGVTFPRADISQINYHVDEPSVKQTNYRFIRNRGFLFVLSIIFFLMVPWLALIYRLPIYVNFAAPVLFLWLVGPRRNRIYVATWLRSFQLAVMSEKFVDGQTFAFRNSSKEFFLFSKVANCAFPGCRGIVRVQATQGGQKLSGVCQVDDGHIYSYNSDGVGYYTPINHQILLWTQ